MKRIIALILLAALTAGCSAEPKGIGLDRTVLLPDDTVESVAGTAMKPALDERDDAAGIVRWAWEEADGAPKLLLVEVYFAPSDCDALYNRAQSGQGTAAIKVPMEAIACIDGRAAHIRFGEYYVRIETLGIADEKGAAERVAARLISGLIPKK